MKKLVVNSYRILLALGFILIPLFFWPKAYVVHEVPKVWLIFIWIELLALLTLTRILIKDKQNKLSGTFPVFIFIASLIVSSLFGVDLAKSFLGNYFRLDGLVTLLHLFAFTLCFALYANKKDIKLVLISLITGTGILSFWAIGEVVLKLTTGIGILALKYPIGIAFGQPNFLGGYLAVTTPIYFYLLAKASKKSAKIGITILMLMQFVAVTLTHSVGAMMTVLLAVVLWFLLATPKIVKIAATTLFISMIGLYLYKYLTIIPGNDLVYEGRQRIILRTLSGINTSRRYLLGYGVANVDYAFNDGTWPIAVNSDVYLDKAHSTLQETFLTGGFTGLIAYLGVKVWLLDTLKTTRRSVRRIMLLLLALYLFHAQTNVISISQELLFWLVLGFALQSKHLES